MGKVECNNPRWIDGQPAWDITLSNGAIHTDVTGKDIGMVLRDMARRGEIHPYRTHIDVVRQHHIEAYDAHHAPPSNCEPTTSGDNTWQSTQ